MAQRGESVQVIADTTDTGLPPGTVGRYLGQAGNLHMVETVSGTGFTKVHYLYAEEFERIPTPAEQPLAEWEKELLGV